MQKPYIIYNGVSSESLGLQIEQISSLPMPVRKYDYTDVPGADGQIVHDYARYEDVQIEARVNCMRSNAATASVLNAWLTGTGRLTHSDAPGHYYRVKAVQMNTRYRYRPYGQNYDSISVIFLCEPYRYLLSQATVTVSSSDSTVTITNPYNTASEPLIHFQSITVPATVKFAHGDEESTITLQKGGVYIDCAAYTVYEGSPEQWTPAAQYSELEGDWPVLYPGENVLTLTNHTQAVTIYPRWREL